MTSLELAMVAQLLLAGAAVGAVLLAGNRRRALVGGVGSALVAAAGVVAGLLALSGAEGEIRVDLTEPWGVLTLAPDRLGGLFIAVAGGVGLLAAVYGIGYARGAASSRTSWAAFTFFLVGMQMVPAAGDVLTFLLAWEVMAVCSTVLVLTDHATRPQVRSAALWYAGMTQLSFLLLLAGFGVLVDATGSTAFADMSAAGLSTTAASIVFVLLALGFTSKAGVVPLHVWLPRAHPEAPSHVSAAMSAAMVKMGIYGLLLTTLRLLPEGPSWWGALLLLAGAASAVYGILQASVSSDLKRLLAYSTTENVGLMVLAIGVAQILSAPATASTADVALVACLLLVVAHAAFKSVLFLGAGSILHATGERDLDSLGGLRARMPWTAALFGVAALGAAALPVTGGFVAEWVLLQSLIAGVEPDDRLVAVALPLAVTAVALTAGLALLTFAKSYGIAFLALPRSEAAEHAHESGPTMRASMLVGAVAVVALGLVPGAYVGALADAVGADGVEGSAAGGIDLTALGASINPVALTLLAAAVAVPVAVAVLVVRRAVPRRRTALAWGCGGARTSPRMQYNATSYAEPLVRVFDDMLSPSRDVEVTHADESRYLVERIEYRQQVVDAVEVGVYRPVLRGAATVGERARGLQNGSLHRYLGYSFVALLVVLVVVAL